MSDLTLNLNAATLQDLVGDLSNAELLVVTRKANVALGALSEAGLDKLVEAFTAVTWVKGKRENPEYTYEEALESRSVTEFIARALANEDPATQDEDAVDPS